ncbi:MAG TPA: hypothetical protein VN649_17540 [Ramlibacter sp.]|nr:hypothetical protein [Ramlibacter sp.]
MAESSQQPHSYSQPGAAMPATGAPPRWLRVEDDLALGCESAYPSLQIEQWRQEIPQSCPTSS